jgi:hypothetical protein
MVSAARQYTSELSAQLRFLATWPPGVPIGLGMVGTIDDDYVFSPVTSLARLGAKFEESSIAGAGERFSFASAGAVDFSFKAAGATSDLIPSVPQAEAGLGISFKREHATVFQASGISYTRIEDQVDLKNSVIALIKSGRWDRDWVIVTNLVHADSTTAIVSRSGNATAQVALSADAAAGGIELLRAEFKPRMVASSELDLWIVGSGHMTPLFHARRAKRRFFSRRIELRGAYSDDLTKLDSDEHDDDLFDDIEVYGAL